MFDITKVYVAGLIAKFQREEDGLALTEYLLLLGLLTGGVILAVIAFGDALNTLWNGWALFINSSTALEAPAPVT